MKEYFKILGINEGASQEEIKFAYDKLSKELDPNKNGNLDFFIEELNKLQEAYNVLSNSTILKSSEKSSDSTDYEDSNIDIATKSNNDSITITISPEKIEELRLNSKLDVKIKNISVVFKLFCVLNILISSFYLIAFVLVFNNFISIVKSNYMLLTIFSVFYILLIWCLFSTIFGSYNMYKGRKKGYKYFFRGNIVFIIFLFLSLLGNDFKEVFFTVITMLIMSIFGFVFYNYKQELYN